MLSQGATQIEWLGSSDIDADTGVVATILAKCMIYH